MNNLLLTSVSSKKSVLYKIAINTHGQHFKSKFCVCAIVRILSLAISELKLIKKKRKLGGYRDVSRN